MRKNAEATTKIYSDIKIFKKIAKESWAFNVKQTLTHPS